MLYILIFILLFFFSYYYDYKGMKQFRMYCYYGMLLLFVLIPAFRYRIGMDTLMYEACFGTMPDILHQNANTLFRDPFFQPGYLLIASMCKAVTPHFWLVQLVEAVVVNSVVFLFIKRNTKNIFFGVLLYYVALYFTYSTEVMREALAISVFLLGWPYFRDGRIMKSLLVCMAAFLFHSGAIVLFLVPLMRVTIWKWMRIDRYTFLLLVVFLGLGFLLQPLLFDFIINLDISDQITTKLQYYLDQGYYTTRRLNINGIVVNILLNIVLPVFCLVRGRRCGLDMRDVEPMVLINCILVVLIIPIHIIHRYTHYFFPFCIIAMARFIYTRDALLPIKRVGYAGWMLFFSIFIYFKCTFLPLRPDPEGRALYHRYYPYASVFTEKEDEARERYYDIERERGFLKY